MINVFTHSWFGSLQRTRLPLGIAGLFSVIALLVHITVPYSQGLSVLVDVITQYDPSDYQHIIINLTYLPRLAVALICGFALAVAGCVMQFVLRNPIASPTTLGVASGAELGMILSILLLPASIEVSGFIPAFIGGCFATALVFILSAKRGFSPVHMVLAGMVVSLFFGSVNTMLLLLNEEHLTSLFVWGAGSLNQNGWESAQILIPLTVIPTLLLLAIERPLSALQLGDDVASSIGVSVKVLKVISLALAIFVTAAVVSEVGLIGFVGIVAPAIARMLGARKLNQQILVSGLVGSSMLLLADLIIQPFSGAGGEMLPTGAMTALLGAPFLLWLLNKKLLQSDMKARESVISTYCHRTLKQVVIPIVGLFVFLVIVAVFVGKDQTGWTIVESVSILQLRIPRVAVAALAGVGLAIAGTIIQRVSTNPMASPEVLGISSGAALALVIGAYFGITADRFQQMLLGTLGASSVTFFIWWMGRKHNFVATHMLLTGIALSAGLDAFLRIALSSGQDNMRALLTWLSGSTYLVSMTDVYLLGSGILVFIITIALIHKWLDIISLGEVAANSLGVDSTRVRMLLLLLVASITTLATIVIGPLSFVGLLAPHMARSLHQYSAKQQLITASLLGAILMMTADWLGRTFWFPWQFPAGLLASLIGGAYFLYLMRK
ncbi:Fe(3+)-hydroxamate ABC transporter permease FhuB [Vibrio gallaecicus]|uniref:Fe(3+)-hydroxamate ABC transporter permease FhuB n=1 Tax=Vibrio gallaecicus TaxID=552386 RepID=UPI0010C9FD6C|nr:Fe(3+)-hydroxamate ABC transporter permease FhuB [Vibrio gallaecicus]MDN3616955.1 Fe(3+)-hydroxamate ABC transporter permease FhuB [Vibrio gallaecicus]